MTKLMVMEYTLMQMDQSTKVNGWMISNTAREKRPGLMAVNTMVITIIPRKKEEACTHGLMETNT